MLLQSIETESASGATASHSPSKCLTIRSQASTPPLLERSSSDMKKTLAAAMPKGAKGSARRGGFKDSGGLSTAGELVDAPPIWIESERELKKEIEKLVPALDEKQDWTKRIEVILTVATRMRHVAICLPVLSRSFQCRVSPQAATSMDVKLATMIKTQHTFP